MLFPVLFAIHTVLTTSTTLPFFVGTYTSPTGSQGIYRVSLNTETGVLTEPELVAKTTNPSFIALSSSGKYLYAVNESGKGEVSGFSVQTDGYLSLLNTQSTLGGSPCHVSVAPGDGSVLVANYTGGHLASFPVAPDGRLLSATQHFQNAGKGPNENRQEAPHTHSIQIDQRQKICIACDLGTDEILVFPVDPTTHEANLASPFRQKAPAGSGPRHFDLSKDEKVLYVANELGDTVGVYGVDADAASLKELQVLSTLPTGTPTAGVTAAEIFCHPNGRWLYASTRGYDSIACFEILPGGLLKLLEIKQISVKFPRGFAIDPAGQWIVVGGQNSNDIEAIRIDPQTGKLLNEGPKANIGSPVCIVFQKS